MRLFGSERLYSIVDRLGLDEETPIDAKILSNTIENAQKRIEDQNFKRRKYVLTYDDVMNQQRNLIYKQRNDVLNGENISDTIRKMITRMALIRLARESGLKIVRYVEDKATHGMRAIYRIKP